MSLTLRSNAFEHNQAIPARHTGDGEDVSPDLSWEGLPEGTRELALIVDDPDAPSKEPWVHWVLYKLAPDGSELKEGAVPDGALEGKNSFGTIGYQGPAPPRGHGTHHYHFKLYALSEPLDVPPGLEKNALLDAMRGKILDQGEWIGTYQR